MSAYPTSLGQIPLNDPPRKKHWRRFGGKFLMISIAVHLLFALGAAYYIIHRSSPKRLVIKQMPATSPGKERLDHDMKKAEQLKSSSAPAMQRVVALDTHTRVVIDRIESPLGANPFSVSPIGGTGDLAGPGFGPGTGAGKAGTGLQPPLGKNNAAGGALKGEFYDLKLTTGKKATGINGGDYEQAVSEFVAKGWNKDHLSKYLHGSQPLYTTQIFFSEIDTNDAPKAFGSPVPESAGMWIAVYRGEVMAPESGTYHFVGAGDDNIYVRFNGKLVLDNCEHIAPQIQPEGVYHYAGLRNKFVKGAAFTVEAGKYYTIEILIGDQIPNKTMAALLIEKEGVKYEQQNGSPILPPFVTDESGGVPDATLPAHVSGATVWKAKKAFSIFNQQPVY